SVIYPNHYKKLQSQCGGNADSCKKHHSSPNPGYRPWKPTRGNRTVTLFRMGTVSNRINNIVKDVQRARYQTETHTSKQGLSNSPEITKLFSKEQRCENE